MLQYSLDETFTDDLFWYFDDYEGEFIKSKAFRESAAELYEFYKEDLDDYTTCAD